MLCTFHQSPLSLIFPHLPRFPHAFRKTSPHEVSIDLSLNLGIAWTANKNQISKYLRSEFPGGQLGCRMLESTSHTSFGSRFVAKSSLRTATMGTTRKYKSLQAILPGFLMWHQTTHEPIASVVSLCCCVLRFN